MFALPGSKFSLSNIITVITLRLEKRMESGLLRKVADILPPFIHNVAYLYTDVVRLMEKGVNLSGGQKQRLALARGVFAAKDSDLILLDEPTSSVDPKTEIRIFDRMFAAFSDKVVVSALHRLYLLPKFDYIYVLDKGELADGGYAGRVAGMERGVSGVVEASGGGRVVRRLPHNLCKSH